MKIRVVDTTWTIKLLSPEAFERILGEDGDNAGLTDPKTNTVYFRTDELTKETILHEMFHTYFNAMLSKDCSLDALQSEELSAALMGKYAEEYVAKSLKVYNWLMKRSKK